MKISSIFSVVAGLATIVAAIPVDDSPQGLKKRDNWASCSATPDPYWTNYFFDVWTGGDWSNDWGQGLHDNINGQCGWDRVQSWGFSYSGSTGHASFMLTPGWPANCVENAIWLASDPTGAIWGVSCGE